MAKMIGTPITITKGPGGSGGPLTTPDWNQNDETASDYVKNRTHYISDPVETILLEETFIETSGNGDIYGIIPASIVFVEGQTYNITFNGTEYECIAWYYSDLDYVVIGNGSIIGGEGGNGEPFACYSYSDGSCYLGTPDKGAYTLKIVGMIPEVVKLPAQFLMNSNVRNGEGEGSIIEGLNTAAIGRVSHAEGDSSTASGQRSHAEGLDTKAYGDSSHAEGSVTTASGEDSHAEGWLTKAYGDTSHAEGFATTASGQRSHAEGYATIAASDCQHVQGKYNVEDGNNEYVHIVGNGTENARSNAHTLDWEGNAWFAGKIYIGGTKQDDENAGEVALKTDIEAYITAALSKAY